jgi:opacity protein-like surface antigen
MCLTRVVGWIRRKRRTLAVPAVCIPSIFVGMVAGLAPSTASAGLINPRELAALMESTIVDLDVQMISVHHTYATGANSAGTLSYSSVLSASGWQGRLQGNYAGVPVDVAYTGTIDFIGGPTNQFNISYTSGWQLGGETFTGSGSGVYNDPEFGFDIDLVNLSVSGSLTLTYGIASLTISGTKDLDDQELTASAGLGLVDLPVIDASLASAEFSFTLKPSHRRIRIRVDGFRL